MNSFLADDRIETIFSAVHECAAHEREQLLDELCNGDAALREEVASLLSAAGAAEGFLSQGAIASSQTRDWSGEEIGAYCVLRELGRGGMGTVYLAERADGEYHHKVAIKVVGAMDGAAQIVSRFRAERQILASLEHPNIARLLDGGTTPDGHPYLVMEYIDGQAIDAYCRNRGLTSRERIELFLDVCAAATFAHRNLIVHRDLKPANILITADGTAKLLDFGIAKLLDPQHRAHDNALQTRAGLPMMTPEYASPEQRNGGVIDTTTDVYALGVILHELLTDRRPARSTTTGSLPAELALIIQRSLEQAPDHRYPSVEHLAADLRRYLHGQTVSVVPGTRRYRLRKVFARNKLAVGLSGLTVCGLLVGTVAAVLQWRVAVAESERAIKRHTEVRELAGSMVFELASSVQGLPGSTRVRKVLLDKGVTYLDRLAQEDRDDPELRRQLAAGYHKLAALQDNYSRTYLGDTSTARASYEKSLAIREDLLALDPDDIRAALDAGQSYEALSAVRGVNGELESAAALAKRCIDLLEKHIAAGRRKALGRLIRCHAMGAHWDSVGGKHGRAAENLEKARSLAPRQFEKDPERLPKRQLATLARFYEERAEVAANRGNLAAAIEFERKRLALLSALRPSARKAAKLADAHQALASRLVAIGEPDAAIASYRRAIAIWQKMAKKYPHDVRPRQRVAAVYVELAELHVAMADRATDRKTVVVHRKKACTLYRHTHEALQALPESKRYFSSRYTRSGSPRDLRSPLAELCKPTERHATKNTSRKDLAQGTTPSVPATTIATLNGDGLRKLSMLFANMSGNTLPAPAISTNRRLSDIELTELNGDGRPDLLAVKEGVGFSLSKGKGDGSFGKPRFAPLAGLTDLAIVDLDADEILDLVATRSVTNDVLVLLGDGHGGFEPLDPIAVGDTPSAITADDLDSDGNLDLVVANSGSNDVSVLFGNGDGSFVPDDAPRHRPIRPVAQARSL